jgi:hypothetical protein
LDGIEEMMRDYFFPRISSKSPEILRYCSSIDHMCTPGLVNHSALGLGTVSFHRTAWIPQNWVSGVNVKEGLVAAEATTNACCNHLTPKSSMIGDCLAVPPLPQFTPSLGPSLPAILTFFRIWSLY